MADLAEIQRALDALLDLTADEVAWPGGHSPADLAFGDYHDPEYERSWSFFSEGVLYPLVGKEQARTILALLNQVQRAAGMSTW